MTRRMYPCDFCQAEYVSPLAASMCCDPINDLDDEWRGYN